MSTNIHSLLDGKWDDGKSPKDIFSKYVLKKPSTYVSSIIDGLQSKNRRIENGCAEIASLLSEEKPELLYPHLGVFTENLTAKEPVLKWEAACTIGNLAGTDKAKKIPAYIPILVKLLSDKSIVLQGHAVKALAKIAKAYPKEAPTIFDEFVSTKGMFPGNRVGYLVEAMESFIGDKKFEKKVRGFVSPLADSEINSVQKKACRVLKLMDKK